MDIDIISIRFKYSNTNTVSDIEYSNSDTDRTLQPAGTEAADSSLGTSCNLQRRALFDRSTCFTIRCLEFCLVTLEIQKLAWPSTLILDRID